ncbi:alpha/beta hydrolase [Aquimarina addita]|uniref:Alpha/beta hydrolase n=1 Tax=Aquimarina addita TaxID=870485 RepID=A0ABP7X8Z1_9FLAO
MKLSFSILFILFFIFCHGQSKQVSTETNSEKEYNSAIVNVNKYTKGTLMTPYAEDNVPLVIFIMDAGSINRDGNDVMSKNDTFLQLSIELAKQGIASYRFDKRLFQIDLLGIPLNELSFDHFVEDTRSIINYFKKNGNYSEIILAGHGQGSLIGILASQKDIDGYDSGVDRLISIAGNAQSVDQIVIQQLEKQAPGLDKSAAVAFNELKEKGTVSIYDPALESIFGRSVRRFMSSWIKYNPVEEIQQIEIPVLIIQGDKDLQVEVSESEKLKEAIPSAEYVLIENMNHILREIKGGRLENHKSYNEHWVKIIPEITSTIVNFVKQ